MNEKNILRMLQWLILAAGFYIAAILTDQPQLQTGLWKAGHITLGAYLGYWIDCHLFGHFRPTTETCTYRALARAIIVSAAILGMAFGL